MDKKPILDARDLVKIYKDAEKNQVHVLRGASLRVMPGESVAIVGKSGEGKSTLLHILGTLESATSGSLTICGEPIDPSNEPQQVKLRNQTIGFIFQSWNLLDEYTLLDNLLMPAKIGGKKTGKGSPAYLRAVELLEHVGLTARTLFLAKLLSGGEKQRAAIARALMQDPALILADEPSGNLDKTSSRAIHTLLLDSAKKFNKGVVIVTHDLELASLCDMHYLLQDGTLQQ